MCSTYVRQMPPQSAINPASECSSSVAAIRSCEQRRPKDSAHHPRRAAPSRTVCGGPNRLPAIRGGQRSVILKPTPNEPLARGRDRGGASSGGARIPPREVQRNRTDRIAGRGGRVIRGQRGLLSVIHTDCGAQDATSPIHAEAAAACSRGRIRSRHRADRQYVVSRNIVRRSTDARRAVCCDNIAMTPATASQPNAPVRPSIGRELERVRLEHRERRVRFAIRELSELRDARATDGLTPRHCNRRSPTFRGSLRSSVAG